MTLLASWSSSLEQDDRTASAPADEENESEEEDGGGGGDDGVDETPSSSAQAQLLGRAAALWQQSEQGGALAAHARRVMRPLFLRCAALVELARKTPSEQVAVKAKTFVFVCVEGFWMLTLVWFTSLFNWRACLTCVTFVGSIATV